MSVFLSLEKKQADALLAVIGKGIAVYAQGVSTNSAVEDIAQLAEAGAVYSKLLVEIAEEEEKLRQKAKTGDERTSCAEMMKDEQQ
jgi:hypothetical protein